MAESISLASSLLSLAAFSSSSSVTLYNTIQNFKVRTRRVRDLVEELEALKGVLSRLNDTIQAADVNLTTLGLPLLRCGNACKEFEQELLKSSSRSSGDWTHFRDWAKLRYAGDDMDGFRRVLATYKLTFSIALIDANLRRHSMTSESLQSYRDLISITIDDLEAQIESIDEKFEVAFEQTESQLNADTTEFKRIKDERMSTQKCLRICHQLSDQINQLQLSSEHRATHVKPTTSENVAGRLTDSGLQESMKGLALTRAELGRHMANLGDELITRLKTATISDDRATDLARLHEEWDAARQCMEICLTAENNLKEGIGGTNTFATGGDVQFMVSTNDKTLSGRNRGLGWMNRQWGSYLDETTILQLSQNLSKTSIQNEGTENSSSPNNTLSMYDNVVQSKPVSGFEERYGRGVRLMSG